MEVTLAPDPIPHLRPGQRTAYSPAAIRRWGVARFLAEVCPAEPLPIPDLGFTPEENARMDALLAQERAATADGL